MEEKEQTDYAEKARGIYSSIKDHLEPSYRKQYNIRRFFGCFLLFWLLQLPNTGYDLMTFWVNSQTLIAIIWTVIAWIFWHYAFWSYQGGFIDTFSRNIIHFGSIFSLIWKIIIQNIIILVWISFIAPFSGIKTWRKAVKNNKNLFVDNQRNDVWN